MVHLQNLLMKKKQKGLNEMRLNHSIFQTEVQFNAPTKSNDTLRGGSFQTSHRRGTPSLHNTVIITKNPKSQNGYFQTHPAKIHSGCPTCNPPTGKHWRANTAYTQNWSSLSAAKKFVEEDGNDWLDKASGKVSSSKSSIRSSNWRKKYKYWKKKWGW